MLNYSVDSIREERARFARDVEYLREMANDDFTDERFFTLESKFGTNETYEDYLEAASIMEQIVVDESEEDKEGSSFFLL